jgi:hypothetical protein
MTEDDVRRLALSFPGTRESAHMGTTDFRARTIFATLPAPGRCHVKLDAEEQAVLCAAEPASFRPVEGGWGRMGWTRVQLDAVDEATLASALRMAWTRASAPAPKRRR